MPSSLYIPFTIVVAALLAAPRSFAFQSPLSYESVREAYFLGQRHDEAFARLLEKYTQRLPQPKAGPYVASVTFFTPFALLVRQCSQRVNYSAQQAEKEHHGDDEIVVITIEIVFTSSYGALIPTPTGSRSGSPVGYQFRSPDFWKDLRVRVFDGEKKLIPDSFAGEPTYLCDDSSCILSGATLRLEFPATRFTSDTALVQIDPPEGDQVIVDFDLSSLR